MCSVFFFSAFLLFLKLDMTEALAKQLKDAGFPQPKGSKEPYSPELHELVAACGGEFWSLRRIPEGKWLATGRLAVKEGQIPYYESAPYDEPDVAVAELFLSIKLHAKQ